MIRKHIKVNWFTVFMFSICSFMAVQSILYGCTLHEMWKFEKMQTDALNQLAEINRVTSLQGEETESIRHLLNSEQKTDTRTTHSLTEGERECITRVVQAEAGNDIQGCMAVAQTIRDRTTLWDKTVTEVLDQKGQFTQPTQEELSPEAVQAVWAVFDEDMSAFDGAVTHFHADGINPYWSEFKTCLGSRGGNVFYR